MVVIIPTLLLFWKCEGELCDEGTGEILTLLDLIWPFIAVGLLARELWMLGSTL